MKMFHSLKPVFPVLLSAVFIAEAFSQEALLSQEEDYYDFLTVSGVVVRPSLNYRTMSDSDWKRVEECEDASEEALALAQENAGFDVWNEKNLGERKVIFAPEEPSQNRFLQGLNQNVCYRLYGPEVFASYNTKAPFGAYDGGLWQGRGFNTSMTAGARIEAYGFELTLKPQLSFTQNKDFDIMPAASSDLSEFSYYGTVIDAPQRFGDSSFWNFDWGDSEVRWSWRKFTVGFGTQAVWIGPSKINPILSSNNPATFPKLDFGFRKTSLLVPYFGWKLGEIETRFWYGRLTESEYFDKDPENDHNMLSGFTFAYSPVFLPELTLAVTKTTTSKWGDKVLQYAYPGFNGNTIKAGEKGEDQKSALSAEWRFPKVGFNVYGELGIDDFLANGLHFYEYARYPLHTLAYTLGLQKTFNISEEKRIKGILTLEWNNSESSQDYQLWAGSSPNFGSHGQITQGFTNRGQWLGSGIGYGGNSQYLSFKIVSPHGYEKFIIGRNNPDNNYIYSKCNNDDVSTETLGALYFVAFKANFFAGFENLWYVTPKLSVMYSALYDLIINPLYNPGDSGDGTFYENNYWNNFRFALRLKYSL